MEAVLQIPTLRIVRGVMLVAAIGLVAACGLPRSGPNKNEIFAGSIQREGSSFVIDVNDSTNAISNGSSVQGFSSNFINAGQLGAETLRPGDTLSISVWENVDDGVLAGGAGQSATALKEVPVDDNGFIFVPYAGRIRAAGNSPEAIRRIITQKLDEQTPDPQVLVRRVAGDGASVTMIGTGGASGVFPITRPTRTLGSMLASAGGIAGEPEQIKITLVRGKARSTVYAQDLFENPRYDVALRDGDTILLEKDRRFFMALGATGGQSRVDFDRKSLSALEAIARLGGLSPALADPTGVFVFREESERVTERLTGRQLTGPQRVVYVLNLTKPDGIFLARDFQIRDGDTLYVTEAPFVQFNKTIAAVTGSLNSVNSLSNAANSVTGSK